MLKFYVPNAYAIGLNLPSAALYAVTAQHGLPWYVRLLLPLMILACAVFEIVTTRPRSLKLSNLAVILGSFLVWSLILLVYGHVPETGHPIVYEIAQAAVLAGVALVLIGVFWGYAQQKSQYFK